MKTYPELEKKALVKQEIQIISSFMHNYLCRHYYICERGDSDASTSLVPTGKTSEQMIAEHLGYDLAKCEHEIKQLIEDVHNGTT